MQHLSLPVTTKQDEAVILGLVKKPIWKQHQSNWIRAYRNYYAAGGNPFAVTAHDFGPGVAERQYALYDTRKGSGEIKRMRRKEGLKSCPMCGSPVTGDIDHYLPRKVYPEFSIMRANLIPACAHCNSGVKGETIHGNNPCRFIHPYFDDWAANPLWFVEIIPPYKAARFKPKPVAVLSKTQDEIVAFHLENVLGRQFELSMANDWSSLPGQIKVRDTKLTRASVKSEVLTELRLAVHSGNVNCWRAALLRGIAQDAEAIKYLRQEAIRAIVPSV